ncbi:MAG: hypothetical protein ACK5ND_00920 [Bacteroides sp.]
MKRLGLTLAVVLSLGLTAAASNKQPASPKWEGNINVEKLTKYLDLNGIQSEEVSNICEYFSDQMSQAGASRYKQDQKLRNAIYGNLKLMKQTLTDAQYAKYLTVMNMTLKNKGIEIK